MGSNQSSHATDKPTTMALPMEPGEKSSVRGRKTTKSIVVTTGKNTDAPINGKIETHNRGITKSKTERTVMVSDSVLFDSEDEAEDHTPTTTTMIMDMTIGSNDPTLTDEVEVIDEDDDEYDAFVAERRQILEEARMLKQYATFHLHPERPVETTDPTVSARCFFGRDSAPDQETVKEAEERAQILEEARMLKQYATFHLHPERPVETTDPTASARCFFGRASAPDQETFEEAEERAEILKEARLLKQYATFHLHPERPVETTDPTACGRNYFSRPSAPDQETLEEAEERAAIMADIEQLKKYARFHLHPEAPVETTDPTASARCYFSRASAPDQETFEEAEERAAVLADVEQLKRYAGYHLHPERQVPRVDVSGRNFFTRPSAPDQETLEESEERARVLEEARQLKQYATFHLHPEKPVKTTDPTAFGRNFFMRASAPDQESLEESEQRAQVLEDAAMLKKYATFHLHPEKPVKTTDSTAFGRNFFTRPSGSESEEVTSAGHAIMSMQHVFTDDHAFMMDEDMMEDMTDNLRSTLKSALVQSSGHTDAGNSGKESDADSEEEGKLSRSPSSVMLFGLEDPAMSNTVH